MKSKLLSHREALEASLETVNYKISNLKKYFSREQVRCWYWYRNDLVKKLKEFPTVEQIKQSQKRMTVIINDLRELDNSINQKSQRYGS